MSHSVTVVLIADQYIYLGSREVNVHDIDVLHVDGTGLIISVMLQNGTTIVRDDYSRSVAFSVR